MDGTERVRRTLQALSLACGTRTHNTHMYVYIHVYIVYMCMYVNVYVYRSQCLRISYIHRCRSKEIHPKYPKEARPPKRPAYPDCSMLISKNETDGGNGNKAEKDECVSLDRALLEPWQ